MGKAIDDALGGGCGLTGGADLEPFEGERRAGTVAQKTFEPRSVPRRDSYRGIDAEPTGGLPREHVIGDVAFE